MAVVLAKRGHTDWRTRSARDDGRGLVERGPDVDSIPRRVA